MKLMFRKSIQTWVVIFILGSLGASGCSSKPSKLDEQMTQQVKTEPAVGSPDEILRRASDAFANAPGLTVEQKEKLKAIYMRTAAEASLIRTEIGQSKALLFKTIATVDYNSAEVDRLKKRIVDMDQRRLQIMFKALSDVQAVVGFGRGKEEIYERLRDYEMPPDRFLSNK